MKKSIYGNALSNDLQVTTYPIMVDKWFLTPFKYINWILSFLMWGNERQGGCHGVIIIDEWEGKKERKKIYVQDNVCA